MGSKHSNQKYEQSEKGKAARARAMAKRQERRGATALAKRDAAPKFRARTFEEIEQAANEAREKLEREIEAKRLEKEAYYANPPEQRATFANVITQFVDSLEKTWPEIDKRNREFIRNEMLNKLWGVYEIPSSLLRPIFDALRLKHLKYLEHHVACCCSNNCTGDLTEYGFGFESGGEQVRSKGHWSEACMSCRSSAWSDVSFDICAAVCELCNSSRRKPC